jgi:hypothetical protein
MDVKKSREIAVEPLSGDRTGKEPLPRCAHRLAAKDRNGLADSEDVATELRIGLFEVTELVRWYPEWFDWALVPIGSCAPAGTGLTGE